MVMKSVHMSKRCERKEDKGKPINILIVAFEMQDQHSTVKQSTNKWRALLSKRSVAKLARVKCMCARWVELNKQINFGMKTITVRMICIYDNMPMTNT